MNKKESFYKKHNYVPTNNYWNKNYNFKKSGEKHDLSLKRKNYKTLKKMVKNFD